MKYSSAVYTKIELYFRNNDSSRWSEPLEAILRGPFGVQRKKNFKCPYLKIAFSTKMSFTQNNAVWARFHKTGLEAYKCIILFVAFLLSRQ